MHHTTPSTFYGKHTPKSQQGLMFAGFILLIVIIAGIVFLSMYTYKLNATIVAKFESRRWDIPAIIYSRPLTLSHQTHLSGKNLELWLSLLHYDKVTQVSSTGSYQKIGNSYIIHTRGFDYGDGDKDSPQVLKVTLQGDTIAHLQSTQKNTQGMIRLEPVNIGSIYPENNEDRILLTKDNIPQTLVDALIATEDRNFYGHHGISIRGTARALFSNLSGGSTQGGSTITQQLIKNFYLNSNRTFKRKANEAIMALILERHYTKQDILLAYLNEINLGQNGNQSINGFGIASQFYFNKPLSELRLDQYALLVGLAKGPSYYNPRKHPERALQRRNTVLHNMLMMGNINQQDYDQAITEPLSVVKTPAIAKSKFPDFFDVVQRELKKYYDETDLQSAGLKIISTLDPIAQSAAHSAMTTKLAQLKKTNKATHSLEGALVSADPVTGELVALVGSGNEFTGFNRAIDAKRQVGSLLKPIIYLTALQSGQYTLASTINDEPIAYPAGGKSWTPKNYSGQSYGKVPLITALANSYNQSAVNLGMEFGLSTFQKQMKQFGVTSHLPSYPAILLGAVELSPMDMLGVYQVFASGGYHTPIHSIKQVISEKGQVLTRIDDNIKTVARIPEDAMYVANFGLQEVVRSGTAKKALSLGENLKLAGKTGTTNDAKDAWFAGFSGNYVSVVWVGRDDNKPFGLTGGSGALPIWMDYMQRLSLTPVSFNKPQTIEWVWLDKATGLLSDQACPNALYAPALTKSLPKASSNCFSDIPHDETPTDSENISDNMTDSQDSDIDSSHSEEIPQETRDAFDEMNAF